MPAPPLDPKSPTVTLPPIALPLDLKNRTQIAANQEGISFSEAVRRALKSSYGHVPLPIAQPLAIGSK